MVGQTTKGEEREQGELVEDEPTQCRSRIVSLEGMLQKAKETRVPAPIVEGLQKELDEARAQLMEAKPAGAQHAEVARKLGKAKQSAEKLRESVKAKQAAVLEAQRSLDEEQAALQAKEVEVKALEKDFKATAEAAVPNDSWSVPVLEEIPSEGGVEELIVSPAFQLYQRLLAEQQERKGKKAEPADPSRPQRWAESTAEVVMDFSNEELDGLIAAVGSGGKRVLQDFLMQQNFKRTRRV